MLDPRLGAFPFAWSRGSGTMHPRLQKVQNAEPSLPSKAWAPTVILTQVKAVTQPL